MDSGTSDEVLKCSKCCECGCECSIATQSLGNFLHSVKRKHDELEQNGQSGVPGSGTGTDWVARVDIANECNALREAVSSLQQAIQDLNAELEEERSASSTAANEAMSMILRLQREKAEIQMEARQFKRFVEERASHDQQEFLTMEDLLYKREQAIQSLNCEVQAYKHRMMSLGLSESEADGGEYELPYEYPPLRCKVMHVAGDYDNDDVDVEKYAFGETPSDRLRDLENRISQMERTPTYSQIDGDFTGKNLLEVVVGQSPRRAKHSKKFSCDSASFGHEYMMDSPRLNGSFRKIEEEKKIDDASEAGEDICDRVYTIDYVHNNGAPSNGFTDLKSGAGVYDYYASTPREIANHSDFEDPYIKKLYLRLQALEADRESMRQAILSMRTDKAQIVLLKEIAQQLCKEMSPQRKMRVRQPIIVGRFSFFAVFKWIASIVLWRKKAHQIKYMFGIPSDSVGLLMLIDKAPHFRSWGYLSSTQLGD